MLDLRRAKDLWQRCDVTVRDLPLALLLTVLSLLPGFQGHGTQIGQFPSRPYDLVAVAVIALEAMPLAVRRRWPGWSVALVALGFALDQFLACHALAGIALPIALVSAGAHVRRRRPLTIVLLSVAYVVFIAALQGLGANETPLDIALLYLALALSWAIGAWLRSTRAAEAERRRHVAEATRVAERTRIARELHDVVTHHVTAMVVQAEAARYLTAVPDRLDTTLTAVTDTGRRAIADLRNLLDLLNPDHDAEVSTPSAADLPALAEQTRQAGQPVELVQEGEPSRSSGAAEFVAYRVVQEALTNALKYAHGSRTVVHVRYGEKEISVAVSTDGPSTAAGSPGEGGPGPSGSPGGSEHGPAGPPGRRGSSRSLGGSGRGLAGLRERVGALGGAFSAGPQEDGGFLVRARIPLESAS
ncbi:two-component sensor histidine kinase [Nonomuraea sp. FMUSA5-5]|uniref:histidine kinase n=1 Tax=Nonomuraea composti TaxID=2720023 RepID=A0ABX1BMD0_9ACTN|nr:two-component sensor histidine kinase [Nonomuraea sp. FMUSA5-5]